MFLVTTGLISTAAVICIAPHSEPNIAGHGQFNGHNGYRHTFNHHDGNGHAVQQGLRNMLPHSPVTAANVNGGGGKHSTMDSATQNMALQQLRGSAAVADAQNRLMSLQGRGRLVTLFFLSTRAYRLRESRL